MARNQIAKLFATSAVGALCVTAAAGIAHAQQQTPAAPGGFEALEEIIVTAQRRTQALQDVPLSVMQITPDQLQRSGAVTLEGLNGMIPNAVIEHVGLFPGVASLSIRGVGFSGVESFADPQVPVYVNGVYQARNVQALSSTVDVASVEVLRGPQGTLFGRNAFAGVISLTTNRPDMTETTGSADITIGNYGKVDADVVGNIPLVEDKVAARIAVRKHNFDGFYKNNGVVVTGINNGKATATVDPLLEGKSIGKEDSLFVRPSIRFTPNDDWDISVMGEIYRERSEAAPAGHLSMTGGTLDNMGLTGQYPFGDKKFGIASDGSDPFRIGHSLADKPTDVDSWNVTTDAAYSTDIGTIKGIVNFGRSTSEIWSDTDGENYNAFTSARWETYKSFSGELQYISDFSDRLDVIAGLFYFQDHYKTTQLSFTDFSIPFVPDFTVADSTQNPGYINNDGKRKSVAAYAQGEYKLTDELSAVVGARYSWEKKYDYQGVNATLNATGISRTTDFGDHVYPTNSALIFTAPSKSWENLSPRIGLNYKVDSDIMLFGFWQRAFKSGGFNANSADRDAFRTPFGVERVDNYEVGMKSEWLDRRLRANVNVFYAQYDGLQRSLVTPSTTAPSGVVTTTTNAADLESYGVELELAAKPMSQFTVFANLGWNKAQYTSYCFDANGLEPTRTPSDGRAVCGAIQQIGALFLVPTDYSNVKPMRAPRWDITAGFTKEFTVGNAGDLELNASMNYRSGAYVQLLNIAGSYRPPMTTVDASLRWLPDDGDYTVTLWGKNLTNEVEILNYLPVSTLFGEYHATPPRTYGVTFGMKF